MTKSDSLKLVGLYQDYPYHKWFRTQQCPKKVRQMNKLFKYEEFNGDVEYNIQKWELYLINGDRVTMKPRWRRIYRMKREQEWQERLKIAKEQVERMNK